MNGSCNEMKEQLLLEGMALQNFGKISYTNAILCNNEFTQFFLWR